MAKIQVDKKQMPAVIAMGALSAGLFGFFVWKMTLPPAIQAAPKPGTAAAAAEMAGKRDAASAGSLASTGANDTSAQADAPTLALHDPFTPAITDINTPAKPVELASSQTTDPGSVPSVPGLPPVGPLHPLTSPVGGTPGRGAAEDSSKPDWTVTGVVSEPSDPRNRVAILRAGDVRRFVRLGDMVDSDLRLVGVTRKGVTLAAGSQIFHLPLGGDSKRSAPAKSSAVPASQLLPTGLQAPDFTVQDRNGKSVKLSDFRGKVVVLDFWATWCGPCQKSLPLTNSVAQQFAGKGVVVLAVNVWDTPDAFQAWLPQHADLEALDFAIDTSPKGQLATQLYQVSGIPTQYVIDKSGKIVTSFVGASDSDDQLVAAIQQALSS